METLLGIALVFALGLLVALPSALLLLAMHLWRHRKAVAELVVASLRASWCFVRALPLLCRIWLAHRRADRLLRRMREEGGA